MSTTEKTAKVHIDDLHFEHKGWNSELNFFKDEIQFFKARLEEVAKRYTSAEVMKGIEHFQNQFYIQANHIDELLHDIKVHERSLSEYAREHPIAIDHVLFQDHKPLRDRIETNRDILNELKKEYQLYLAKWM